MAASRPAFLGVVFWILATLMHDAASYRAVIQEGDATSGEPHDPQLWLMQTQHALAHGAQRQAASTNKTDQHQQPQDALDNLTSSNANSTGSSGLAVSAAAAATGVTINTEGDLSTFITGLVCNSAACLVSILMFLWLAQRYPIMLKNNAIEGFAPPTSYILNRGSKLNAWALAAWRTTPEQYAASVGLDMACLIMYCDMCMKTLLMLGVPMIFIFGPMNFIFGGFAAGTDYLSYFSIGNVENGKWHYWVYAFVVWAVVHVVIREVFAKQKQFCALRQKWLKELPAPRSTTVLVESIPERQRSDEALKAFFEECFHSGSVLSATVVKDTTEVLAAERAMEACQANLDVAMAPKASAEVAATIPDRKLALREAEREFLKKQEECKAVAGRNTGGVNCSSGFVTFASRKDALVAEGQVFCSSYDKMTTSIPPPPEGIIWGDLKGSDNFNAFRTGLGYLLIIGLYIIYIPCVIWITTLAINFNMGPFQPLWASFAPTAGLQTMIAMLPTFIIWTFRLTMPLKDDTWAQLRLQNWYFVFQVVFVILVTAIGSNVSAFTTQIANHPSTIPTLLGTTMPYATHFYMNFMVLQWLSHSMNLTRWFIILKFKCFCTFLDEGKARFKSEPEDQDYYGLGSRGARFSINMLLSIIFGTLCPWMILLGFVNFFLCRVYYGYLIGFAETKKGDLGGLFFVQKLRYLFVGCIIYAVMMSGVLTARASCGAPAIISICSLIYIILRWRRFEEEFAWEKLPMVVYVEGANDTTVSTADSSKQYAYIQPELLSLDARRELKEHQKGKTGVTKKQEASFEDS